MQMSLSPTSAKRHLDFIKAYQHDRLGYCLLVMMKPCYYKGLELLAFGPIVSMLAYCRAVEEISLLLASHLFDS